MKYFFVSVDPERDTPDDLKEYLNSFHSSIIGVTGTNEKIEEFLKYMHIYKNKVFLDENNYTIDHSSQNVTF